MEAVSQYLGEIMVGGSVTFITMFIRGYSSLMGRIKKLEEDNLKLHGKIDINTALDNERKK